MAPHSPLTRLQIFTALGAKAYVISSAWGLPLSLPGSCVSSPPRLARHLLHALLTSLPAPEGSFSHFPCLGSAHGSTYSYSPLAWPLTNCPGTFPTPPLTHTDQSATQNHSHFSVHTSSLGTLCLCTHPSPLCYQINTLVLSNISLQLHP